MHGRDATYMSAIIWADLSTASGVRESRRTTSCTNRRKVSPPILLLWVNVRRLASCVRAEWAGCLDSEENDRTTSLGDDVPRESTATEEGTYNL